MKITIEGWDPVDRQPVRGTLEGVDRAQTQAADLVTVTLEHGSPVQLKQNPTALRGNNIRVGACAWDGAYVLAAYLDAQPPGSFAGKRCVELGAGMGLVGLVLARLGAAVYLTDKPSMTVHARVNAAKNRLLAAVQPPASPQPAAAPAPVAAGSAAVVGLDWEDVAAAAAAAADITSHGPVDLIVATDCIYPDPNGTVPSSSAFAAAVAALSTPGHSRLLVSFEARSDDLRAALLSAAAEVAGSGQVRLLQQEEIPAPYRTQHIEIYELQL